MWLSVAALCASAFTSPLAVAQQKAAGSPVSVVAYVANLGLAGCVPPGCEWYALQPPTGRRERIFPLPGPPLNVFWDPDFSTVYYRVGDTGYRQPWHVGGIPERLFGVPAQLVASPDAIQEPIDDLWRDRDSGAWRLLSVLNRDTQPETTVWEYSSTTRGWSVLGSSMSCDRTAVSCDPIEALVAPERRTTLRDLQAGMRVERHLERAEPGGAWNEGPHVFPSTTVPGTSVRVGVLLGDTFHAWAPLVYLNRQGVASPIYETVEGCYEQVAFEEASGFLLVAEEFTGACARLVDMGTGRIVAALPSTSQHAVWVRAPR
jgi:hypothetical protein